MSNPVPSQLPLHLLHPQVPADRPQPPFMAVFQDYLILGVSYDRSAIRHLVPGELSMPAVVSGFIAMGSATASGWGTDRFSNFYLALEVEGLAAPDGTPGNFRPVNIYSPSAAQVFRPLYNAGLLDGDHSFSRAGNLLRARIVAADGLTVEVVVRVPSEQPGQPASGIHHYMGLSREQEITSFHTSYTGDFSPVEVVAFSVAGSDAAARLPTPRFTWATISRSLAVSIGAPRGSPFYPAAGTPEAAALTSLLSRIGHAAACIDSEGQLLGANAAARAILRPLGRISLLQFAQENAQPATLRQRDMWLPIIVRPFPLDPALLGRAATLVLLNDPAAPGNHNPSAVLLLLGLTPAEARVAAIVGTGLPPREAARLLGLTEHTVRSALKVVFDKLGLARQAELSRLITRLEGH